MQIKKPELIIALVIERMVPCGKARHKIQHWLCSVLFIVYRFVTITKLFTVDLYLLFLNFCGKITYYELGTFLASNYIFPLGIMGMCVRSPWTS
jgi:hypothetical protein